MDPDEIRGMLTGGDIATPFTVHTMGGRSYPVSDPAHIWSPPGFPGTVVIAIPRRAIAVLRLDAIDSITCEEQEHEPAAAGRK
jgi:hypothetical protein